MQSRKLDRLDALLPNWAAGLLVAAITLTLTCLFFA
jgi:hypothetical protein